MSEEIQRIIRRLDRVMDKQAPIGLVEFQRTVVDSIIRLGDIPNNTIIEFNGSVALVNYWINDGSPMVRFHYLDHILNEFFPDLTFKLFQEIDNLIINKIIPGNPICFQRLLSLEALYMFLTERGLF